MNIRSRLMRRPVWLLGALLAINVSVHAQPANKTMTNTQKLIAKGSFEVDVKPVGTPDTADENMLGRMSLDKRFAGDMVGTGKGEMLTALTGVKGSAGYVAIERVTATIAGKSGSFVLQHSGTMDHGTQHLSITVVPDSGTGQLQGIRGDLRIRVAEGKHFYEFEYSMPK